MARKKQIRVLSDEELAAIHAAEHQPSQAQKWDTMTAEDVPMVREALLRAQTIREAGTESGDAYLQGIADAHYALRRRALIHDVCDTIGSAQPKS